MKRFLLFPMIFVALAIGSCSRDNDPEPENPFVGTWHLMEVLIISAPNEYQSYVGYSFAPAAFDIFSELIIISRDNNFVVKRNNIEYEPVEINQQGSLSLVWGGRIDTFGGTYQFQNDQLVLDFEFDPSETYSLNGDGTLRRDVQLGVLGAQWIYRKY
jgi:hypothetical protein